MRKNSAVPPSHGGWPAWYDGKNINEVLFCEEFLAAHPMKCIRGRLFTVDGAVEDEAVVSQQILETVSGCVTSGLSKLVSNLLASIKLQAYSPPLPIETDRIHVANGTYFMDGRFSPEKTYCNTAWPWAICQTPPDRSGGCGSSPNCWNRRTSPPCRSTWATACCPPLGPRRCCSSSAGAARAKAGLAW